MAQPTAYEQYMLELINAARANPAGAARKYGFNLGSVQNRPYQPLAFNEKLGTASDNHNSWMNQSGQFSHRGRNGSTPSDRATAAGYSGLGVGENIARFGGFGQKPDRQKQVEAAHRGLLRSPGHMRNIMRAIWNQAGVGELSTGSSSGRYNFHYTQMFGRHRTSYLTGVAFSDKDGDKAYDPGEGLGGVKISVKDTSGKVVTTTSWNAGGYKIALKPGQYSVTFSGGGLKNAVTKRFAITDQNVKVDLNSKNIAPKPQPKDDFAGDASTKGKLAVGKTLAGNIEKAGDKDWVKVNLKAGQTYRITANGAATRDGTLADPKLRVIGADGKPLAANGDDKGTGKNDQIDMKVGKSFVAKKNGLHFIQVESGAKGGTGTYKIGLSQKKTPKPDPKPQPKDDFAGDASTKGKLAVGKTLAGNIEKAGDKDWVKVNLKAGQTYRITANGAATRDGTLADPKLRVIGADGKPLAVNGDDKGTGKNDQIDMKVGKSFVAKKNGLHFIQVESGAKDGTGTYKIGLSQKKTPKPDPKPQPKDDFAGDASTKGKLAVGKTLAGSIEKAGDKDWIRIRLEQGKLYQFNAAGVSSSAGNALSDPKLSIVDSKGRQISWGNANSNRGHGANEKGYYIHFNKSGDYYLKVSSGKAKGTGSYKVNLREYPGDKAGGVIGCNNPTIGDGLSVTGTTGGGDVDVYRMELKKGREYTVTVAADNTNAGRIVGKPNAKLTDASGKKVGNVVKSDDNQIVMKLKPSKDGVYHVATSGNPYRPDGDYKISLSSKKPATPPKPKDDFAGDASTKGKLAIGKMLTGNIEKAGDTDWVKVRLEKGKIYAFYASGASSKLGTLSDPALEIVDAKGKRVFLKKSPSFGKNNQGRGNDEAKVMHSAVPATGDYFLRISSARKGATGTYRLAVRDTGKDEAGRGAADGWWNPQLTKKGWQKGSINYTGDIDVYRIDAKKGRSYTFVQSADNSRGAMMSDNGKVDLLAAGDKALAGVRRSVSKDGNVLRYTAKKDGPIYLRVQSKNYGSGDYKVKMTESPAPAPARKRIAPYVDVGNSLAAPCAGNEPAPLTSLAAGLSIKGHAKSVARQHNSAGRSLAGCLAAA